jgi:hypothetical protein
MKNWKRCGRRSCLPDRGAFAAFFLGGTEENCDPFLGQSVCQQRLEVPYPAWS